MHILRGGKLGRGHCTPRNVERRLFDPYVVIPVPKPIVGGRGLVALIRLSADEEDVLLRVARHRHDAVVGDLLK